MGLVLRPIGQRSSADALHCHKPARPRRGPCFFSNALTGTLAFVRRIGETAWLHRQSGSAQLHAANSFGDARLEGPLQDKLSWLNGPGSELRSSNARFPGV